jgi:hypothetical protein
MTWTKLSDDFTDDTWTLSDAAYRLHSDGLVWSNRKLLDLHIPKDDLRRFKKPEAIKELLDGGWWASDGDHYVIVHHARYQRMRDAVINQQTVNKENRAKRGQVSPPTRELGQPKRPTFQPSDESSHESLSDSTNEMDWSVRANYKEASTNEETNLETGEVTTAGSEWPTAQPGSGGLKPLQAVESLKSVSTPFSRCRVCNNQLVSAPSQASGLCRKGDAEHEAARPAA